MKIRPVGAELFHTERQIDSRTDRQIGWQTDEKKNDEANSRFLKFCECA